MAKRDIPQKIVTAPKGPAVDQLLEATQAATAAGGLPPVHLWNPPFCGDIDMVIRRDGTWLHEGSPITRPALVRLFSRILKREGDRYFLVTPVEKVGIQVEDTPFVAQDFDVTHAGDPARQVVTFTTNVGDTVAAGPDAAIRVEIDAEAGDAPAPHVHVRAGLDARIDRKSFYRLIDLAQTHTVAGTRWLGIWSGGVFFRIVPESDLPAD
jgi:hypothetical protein